MKYIKQHKKLTIIIAAALAVVILGILLIQLLLPSSNKNACGNRVSDIANHQISNDAINKVKDALTSSSRVNDVSYNLVCRTMSFVVKIESGVERDSAKDLVNKITENLDENIISYYDIEVYFKSLDEENGSYPFMAYKNKNSKTFSFTNAG